MNKISSSPTLLLGAMATFTIIATTFGCVTSSTDPMVKADIKDKMAVLRADDIVEILVFGEEELSGVHEISSEGTIHLPLIRDVEVAGLAPLDAQRKIESLYNAKYLKKAQVELSVKEYNSRKVYVLGSVKQPGPYNYKPGMTVIGALSLAGGPTRLAALNRTRVTRNGENDTQTSMVVEANDIQKGTSPDVEIAPGDIIFIPESLY